MQPEDPMQAQDKVLACVDQSHFADFVTDAAAWAARQMDAPLELLHILDRDKEVAIGKDHSGAIGVNAQQNLLSELSEQDESRSKENRERGRKLLNGLRERAIRIGVEAPDVRQRYGDLEETHDSRCRRACPTVRADMGAGGSRPRPPSVISGAMSPSV